MNNNSRGQKEMNARELTREIDELTDATVAEATETFGRRVSERETSGDGMIGRERAQQMGAQVIGGSQHNLEGLQVEQLAQAEREVVQDERELTQAQEFVGSESPSQVEERLAADWEDAQNEAGEGLEFENRIVAKNQETVAKIVTPEVDRLVGQRIFRLADLEKIYRDGVNAALGTLGRSIGDRN